MGILSSIKGVFTGGTVEKAAVARRRFDGAVIDRFTAGWMAENNAIDSDLKSDLDRLRQRARDLAKNNDYVRQYLQMVQRNVVGPSGISFQATVTDPSGAADKLANDAIESGWQAWGANPEVTGRHTLIESLRLAIKSAARDGEILIRHVRGPVNRFGYAFQLLDIRRLDTAYNVDNAGLRVVMGVELDTWGKPQAYHLRGSNEGSAINNRQRIPASEIIHAFVPEEAEQTRGFPWLHAVIHSLHDLGEYNRSALLAARKGADTLGFFVSPNGEPPMMDAVDEAGQPIAVSVPGSYDTLPEGYDFRPYDSQYPSATYGDFVKAILRRIATGLGVSYNVLANDLEGVNFSSIRAGVLEERDQWMATQRWFIDSVLEPIFAEWISAALLNGALTMPNGSALPLAKADKFASHQFRGRRWQWVDPLKDIEAARLAIQTGVSSPQRIAAQMGVDVEDIIDELARFEDYVQSASVSSVAISALPKAGQPPAEEKP